MSINTIARNVDDKFYDKIETNIGSIDEFSSNELVSKFQITHSILKHPDKILALEFYLKSNKNDNEGDSWIFGHHPNIENHLLSLTEPESVKLQTEILNWNESEKFNIADAISDTFISELCCEGDKIKDVIDTLTFRYLGSSFYKDKNNVYTHFVMADGGNFWIVKEADVKTFDVIGNSCYAKDKNFIFGERAMKMPNVDYKTFKTCDDCGC